MRPPNLFCFKIVLANPLRFHMNFRLEFSISAENFVGIFDRDCSGSVDNFHNVLPSQY